MKRLIILIIVLAVAIVIFAGRRTPSVIENEIVGKFAQDSKHYLTIVVEVSPEEYIGYDIGDKYNAVFNAQ